MSPIHLQKAVWKTRGWFHGSRHLECSACPNTRPPAGTSNYSWSHKTETTAKTSGPFVLKITVQSDKTDIRCWSLIFLYSSVLDILWTSTFGCPCWPNVMMLMIPRWPPFMKLEYGNNGVSKRKFVNCRNALFMEKLLKKKKKVTSEKGIMGRGGNNLLASHRNSPFISSHNFDCVNHFYAFQKANDV